MNCRVLITILFFLHITKMVAIQPIDQVKNANIPTSEIVDPDSVLTAILGDTIPFSKLSKVQEKPSDSIIKPAENKANTLKLDSIKNKSTAHHYDSVSRTKEPVKIEAADSLLFLANPLLIELVYTGVPYDFNWIVRPDLSTLLYGSKATTLSNARLKPIENISTDQFISDLRQTTRDKITAKACYLYATTFDELPDPDGYKNLLIKEKPLKKVNFVGDKYDSNRSRHGLVVKREKLGPWQYKASALAQFSESVVSGNWYQGGNSNIAILGILSGQLNYDNKKDIQWDNSAEWRLGFNSVAGDTLRALSTNDDVLKIASKLGVKASGNFYYSGSVDFSTQFFNSYNGVNSTVMKTSFLTPVRVNIGLGLDYKYKKIFSLMLSPVSYKYIYVSDNVNVDPNLFGIAKGGKHLSEIGSSFKSILSYPLSKEVQLDSKLTFYTNYQKVEVDWEMVCNMTINRFLSTRISFNPRYDNTIIEADGSKAKMQFKQFLSVGFSHKF